jgi:colanic acid biosynthesis protein WcaH
MSLLPIQTYTAAAAVLPLISVDLCLTDRAGNLLLGWRNNSPAKDCWFTPGGRIRRNEPLKGALARVCQEELNISLNNLGSASLMGAWDHFYSESAFDPLVSAHYVNLPHWLPLTTEEVANLRPPQGADEQHQRWTWMPIHQAAQDDSVHSYVQAYARWLLANDSR